MKAFTAAHYLIFVAGIAIVMAVAEAILDFPWYMDTLGWFSLFITAVLSADKINSLQKAR